jgi:hypothetical protein
MRRLAAGTRRSRLVSAVDDIGAPAGDDFGKTFLDQDAQGLGGGSAGDAVLLDQAGDGRQALARPQLAGLDAPPEDGSDLPVGRDVAVMIDTHAFTIGDLV